MMNLRPNETLMDRKRFLEWKLQVTEDALYSLTYGYYSEDHEQLYNNIQIFNDIENAKKKSGIVKLFKSTKKYCYDKRSDKTKLLINILSTIALGTLVSVTIFNPLLLIPISLIPAWEIRRLVINHKKTQTYYQELADNNEKVRGFSRWRKTRGVNKNIVFYEQELTEIDDIFKSQKELEEQRVKREQDELLEQQKQQIDNFSARIQQLENQHQQEVSDLNDRVRQLQEQLKNTQNNQQQSTQNPEKNSDQEKQTKTPKPTAKPRATRAQKPQPEVAVPPSETKPMAQGNKPAESQQPEIKLPLPASAEKEIPYYYADQVDDIPYDGKQYTLINTLQNKG